MTYESLMSKMLKLGNDDSAIMSESIYFKAPDYVDTNIPIINIAFSGKLNGGMVPGVTIVAGESKSFKTLISLQCMKSYLDRYPDSIGIVYDTEYGITVDYLKSVGIDPQRVMHIPVVHVEGLKFDLTRKLEELEKNQKVFFLIDSLGFLPSKKENDDALDEKAVADLSRAKAIRSLLRNVTSRATKRQVPLFIVNHFYETMEMYAKKIISGGQAVILAANQAFIITKAQEKDGTELVGWNFTVNVEKSRFVREKSKLKFTVKYKGGLSKYSGLLDIALESGHVVKPKNGRYARVDMETGEIEEKSVKEKDTFSKEFWEPIISCPKFNKFIEEKFLIANGKLMEEDDEEVYSNLEEDDVE